MKISIWQQFSSNHSNGFTLVGEFPSEDDAKQAAKQLEDILKAIYLQSIGYYDREPLQTELDLGKEFNIEWIKHLDWINVDEYDHVQQFDQFVALSDHHGNTWQGKLYVDQIMSNLASKVYSEGEMDINAIGVELSCVAPSLDIATAINAELSPYFDDVRAEKAELEQVPWKKYVKSKINKNYDYHYADAYYGYIHCEKLTLKFDHMTFGTIGIGFPALIIYLKERGCTKIKYSINNVPRDELYEE